MFFEKIRIRKAVLDEVRKTEPASWFEVVRAIDKLEAKSPEEISAASGVLAEHCGDLYSESFARACCAAQGHVVVMPVGGPVIDWFKWLFTTPDGREVLMRIAKAIAGLLALLALL